MKNNKRIMIQCRSEVKRDAVKREVIDGIEYIIVSSATLPDNIVMNGGLYPADEVAKSYQTLEMTLAPVEHPHIDGEFISANDPRAIHAFHAGAFNRNVRQEGGRVLVDKYINVSEANRTDRGKRLLDRIKEIETSSQARPLHTSVGVFLEVEYLDDIKVNADNHEYSWIARELMFDHDAILLDSVGAAQPHQGVGVAVNNSGQKINVDTFMLSASNKPIIVVGGDDNADLNQETKPNEGDAMNAMKDLILNALKEAEVKTEGLSDSELFAEFQKLNVNKEAAPADKPKELDIAGIVANAVTEANKPLVDELSVVKGQLKANETAEIEGLSTIIVNSGKYAGLTADSLKLLPVDELKAMAANCGSAYGVSPVVNSKVDDEFAVNKEMQD